MEESSAEEISFSQFLQQEIHQQVLSLKQASELLGKNENEAVKESALASSLEPLGEMKKRCEELLRLIRGKPWSALMPLVQQVQESIVQAESEKIIPPQLIHFLSDFFGWLLSLSEKEGLSLPLELEKQTDKIEDFHAKIKSIINRAQAQAPEDLLARPSQVEGIIKPSFKPLNVSTAPFDPTMYGLFCIEIETQGKILSQGLLEIEKDSKDLKLLEKLMRSAHSIKGAARVVNLQAIVPLAHAMEDVFASAQKNQLTLASDDIDLLFRVCDFFGALAKEGVESVLSWIEENEPLITSLIEELTSLMGPATVAEEKGLQKLAKKIAKKKVPQIAASNSKIKEPGIGRQEKVSQEPSQFLRISTESLNKLMGLAGESLVESHRLPPFIESLRKTKALIFGIEKTLNAIKEDDSNHASASLKLFSRQLSELYTQFGEQLSVFDEYIWRHEHLSDRLYYEVIKSRMRPFADGIEAFPRMTRDLSKQIGKQIRLQVDGRGTLVDRDILEKLESPLSHLLRNAIDHGVESPKERLKIGKPLEGVVKIEARHRAGMLLISVSDDGRGIDIERIRQKIVEKNLASEEMASRLSESEVIDFLFLPGFSTSSRLTEISGRGVGLNIVQEMIQEVRGTVKVHSALGKGTTFFLQLPLTLSVIRALLVDIAGEPYAFPLAHIAQTLFLSPEKIDKIENRHFFQHEGKNVGLICAWEILELNEPHIKLEELPVVLLSGRDNDYGVVVDRFIEEKELVLQNLDPRLGKVPNISSGSFMEDGSPLLVLDVEDMIRSIDCLLFGGRLSQVSYKREGKNATDKQRILVVDDSITVRELECRLLQSEGYEVEVAINGADGWNAVRLHPYDLVITDIDMPRMNGIELLKLIKGDPKLHQLPVIVVSYKEGEGDLARIKEAGADCFLSKSNFEDRKLLDVVKEIFKVKKL